MNKTMITISEEVNLAPYGIIDKDHQIKKEEKQYNLFIFT